ncbi:MAG: RidA family protein [Cyclobacteriaceae bacterium]|nr:RidA family protein [Cyclobacteriaceae bacterium]
MQGRQNIPSGAPWEDIVGYSRAVRIGNVLEVSGTVAVDEQGVVGKGDFYAQTRFIIQKIEGVLAQAGYTLEDVIRTRTYVTDIRQWEAVGKAHGEFFRNIKPATSMIQVSGFIAPEYLVEMEVTAIKQ